MTNLEHLLIDWCKLLEERIKILEENSHPPRDFVRCNECKQTIKEKKMAFKHMVVEYLFNDETKAKVIKELNENINIPIINEKTEEKIITAIWETVEAVLKKVILK
tara:strand:- start:2979 stop:3296 length:318 start_codon:yes stop_codon:yes gene_type:complete